MLIVIGYLNFYILLYDFAYRIGIIFNKRIANNILVAFVSVSLRVKSL